MKSETLKSRTWKKSWHKCGKDISMPVLIPRKTNSGSEIKIVGKVTPVDWWMMDGEKNQHIGRADGIHLIKMPAVIGLIRNGCLVQTPLILSSESHLISSFKKRCPMDLT